MLKFLTEISGLEETLFKIKHLINYSIRLFNISVKIFCFIVFAFTQFSNAQIYEIDEFNFCGTGTLLNP